MKRFSALFAAFLVCGVLFAQTPQEEDLDPQYATELLAVGSTAPDFTLNDLEGKPVSLSQFKGKTIVLIFWASWCPDCRAEIPQLKEMYAKANPKEVAFVSVSFDRKFETLCAFAKENDLPGIQLFDPSGKKDSAVSSAYHIRWIPSLYVIGPDGKVALATVMASKVAAAIAGK